MTFLRPSVNQVYPGLRFTTAVNATLVNGLGLLITGLLAVLLIREPICSAAR